MVTVVVNAVAEEQFNALPHAIKPRVQVVIDRLKLWPAVSGVKPLTGNLAGHYRVRTGDYRAQFMVETTRRTVTVETPAKRKKG